MKQTTKSASLSDVLLVSADCVRLVLSGRSLTEILAEIDPTLRAAAQSISFYTMRQLATAQALSRELLSKKAPDPRVHALLLVSLALLSAPDEAESNEQQAIPRYAEHTVVDQAVKAAQQRRKTAPFKGLINACLRRFLREKESLMQKIATDEQVRYGFPQWWIDIIRHAYPEQWEPILASANTPGPLSLRVNQRKSTRQDFCQRLTEAGMSYQCFGEDAVILTQAVPVAQIPGFTEGVCAVQDAGAQLAAQLLPLKEGMRVLDACAAPGGKTAHILERADVQIWALDVEPQRLARVQENLQHLALFSDNVHLVQADATDCDAWWDGQAFDVILADVPCTASGIVRRHPDIKWLRQEGDIAKTVALQREIIRALWKTLASGGYFLYVTCSVFPQEGLEQAEFIEQTFVGAQRLDAPAQLLPVVQECQQRALHDGFFYALFRKE